MKHLFYFHFEEQDEELHFWAVFTDFNFIATSQPEIRLELF